MRPPDSDSRFWVLGLVLALGVMGWGFSRDFTAPWTDNVDANGAAWSQSAHNTLRAGLRATAGVPSAFYFGSLAIPPDGYYTHHPPTLSLMLTGMFAMLGEKEWVARLLPIGFSFAGVVLLWLLVKQCAGRRAAAFAVIVFASAPMELVYGRMVNFEPVVLVWMLASLLSLRRWESFRSAAWRNAAAAFLVLAMWTAWLGYLFALTLCIYFLIARHDRRPRFALSLITLAVLSLVLFFLHIRLANPDAWRDLMASFNERLARAGIEVAWSDWGKRMAVSLTDHIAPAAWALGAAGAAVAWSRRRKDVSLRWLGWAAFCFAVFSAFYVTVFRNASMIHDYAGFFFTVPVAMMAGVAIDALAAWCALRGCGWRLAGVFSLLALSFFLIITGERQALALRSPFRILDGEKTEVDELIPALGRAIRAQFPEDTNVICNFLRYYGPQLHYYAQRDLITGVMTHEDWAEMLADESNAPLGGVIWTGDADARDVLAHLPPGTSEGVEVSGEQFVFWKPGK
ncbi:MAG: glycosyltransferase family 39 protein [Chthoniobacteraceae bacterium]